MGSRSESNRGVAAEPSQQKRCTPERSRNGTMDVRADVCEREAGGEEGEKRAGSTQFS